MVLCGALWSEIRSLDILSRRRGPGLGPLRLLALPVHISESLWKSSVRIKCSGSIIVTGGEFVATCVFSTVAPTLVD